MDTGLRRLRYFRQLAADLNFRRAATRLNITQPALSRAIAQLESEIGTRLFARTNRQVALTLAGHAFAKGCDRTLASLDAAIDDTRRVARGHAGTLTLGYTDTAIAGCLPDIVEGFAKAAPDVTIRLIQAFTGRQATLLAEGQLDVALMTGPVTSPGIGTIPVQSDRLMALLPAAHPLAARATLALTDLAAEPFVTGDPDRWAAFNAHLFAHCDRAGFRPNVVQTAPESRAITGLVSCGLGVTILPESLVTTPDPRLAARPLRDLDARIETLACWREDDVQPALRHFLRHLEGCAVG